MSAIQWSRSERLLALPPRVSIADAAELHRLAVAAVGEGGTFEVDASQVSEIDTAALQILAALWAAAAATGTPCRWHGSVPQAVRMAARLIGLQTHLQLHVEGRS